MLVFLLSLCPSSTVVQWSAGQCPHMFTTGCWYWCETDLLDVLETQQERNLLSLTADTPVLQAPAPYSPPGQPTTVALIFQLPGRWAEGSGLWSYSDILSICVSTLYHGFLKTFLY